MQQGKMQNLQELSIEECDTMGEIFETKEINHNNISGCSSSTKVAIPRPANSTTHKLPNLKILKIHKCNCLEHIFTFSTLKSLMKLEMLEIRYCNGLEVIVKEEAREDTKEISQSMVFPQLKSVVLDSLPNLAGFFLGVNIDFQWPRLEYVMINDCLQIRVFTTSQSTAPRLKYIHTKLGKHNLECGLNFYETPTLRDQIPSLHGISLHPTVSEERTWSFYNLIECNYYHDERTKIFQSSELQQLQNLDRINYCVEGDSYVEEVFEVALEEVTKNESQAVVNIPKLKEVYLSGLNSLKYIWKNNHRRILEFPSLTTLSIDGCRNLKHVFTCSMVSCVVQLQELHIQKCPNMKAIVKEKEEEDCDAKVSEIIFPCLKSLKLEYLWKLEGFCLRKANFKLPSLNTLVIMGCSDIKVFTAGRSVTPQLKTLDRLWALQCWERHQFIYNQKNKRDIDFEI